MFNKLLNPEDVAARFSRSLSWFYKNYKMLSKKQGFPKPHKLNGYNLQWSEAEVDFWFNARISKEFRLNDNNVGVCYEKLLAANAQLL